MKTTWPDRPRRHGNHYDQMPIGCECQFLDSGSFTLWRGPSKDYFRRHPDRGPFGYYNTRAHRRYLDAYAEFVKKYQAAIDYYSNVDVIPNPDLSWRNQQYLEKEHGLKPVPVIHFTTDVKWVSHYIDRGYDFIALGMMGKSNTPECRRWVDRAFGVICDSKTGLPRVRTHGFAITNWKMLWRNPWWSTDSARWTKAGAYGKLLMPHRRGGEWDFREQPYEIVVSKESQNGDVPGWKYASLSRGERAIVHAWLDEIETKFGTCDKDGNVIEYGVSNSHLERKAANLLFYERLRFAIPEYPWPFRPPGRGTGFGL